MTETDTETLLRRALADALPDPPARPDLYAGVRRRVATRRHRRTAAVAGVAAALVGAVALAWPRPAPGPDTLTTAPAAMSPAPSSAPVRPKVPRIGPLYVSAGGFGAPTMDAPASPIGGFDPFSQTNVLVSCDRIDGVIGRHLLRLPSAPAGLVPVCYVEHDPASVGLRLPNLNQPFSAGVLYLRPGTTLHHDVLTLTEHLGGLLVEERFNAPTDVVPTGDSHFSGIYVLNGDGTHHAALLSGPPLIRVTRIRSTTVTAAVQLTDGVETVGGNITPDQALAYALSLRPVTSGAAVAPATHATSATPPAAAEPEPPAAVLDRLDSLAEETAAAAVRHPSHWGGEYLDDRNRQLVVQVTGSAAQAAPLLPPDARPEEVRVEVVAHTYAALEQVVAAVKADLPLLSAHGIDVTSWGPDGATNGVVLAVVRPAPGTAAFLAHRYAPVPVRVIPLAQRPVAFVQRG